MPGKPKPSELNPVDGYIEILDHPLKEVVMKLRVFRAVMRFRSTADLKTRAAALKNNITGWLKASG